MGGSQQVPAGVDPNRRIRGAGSGRKPGSGTPNARGAGWASGNAHDRARLVLVMEAAAARRTRALLLGPAWWGGKDPT